MSDLQANSVYWWEVAEEAKAEIARLRAELAARDNAAVDAIAQAYEDGRISACNAGKPGCPRVAALEAECERLREALVGITSNPYISLDDLIYNVREREGEGWDGPAVKAWCEAVKSVNEAIAASKPKEPKS